MAINEPLACACNPAKGYMCPKHAAAYVQKVKVPVRCQTHGAEPDASCEVCVAERPKDAT